MKIISLLAAVAALAVPAAADPFFFSNGNVNGSIGIASRPGPTEIEGADDFLLGSSTLLTSATFTGLLTGTATTANIGQVVIEIYRVFPLDSDTSRTSGSPTFGTTQVPTRVNSPSDVAFDSRDATGGGLTFAAAVLSANFTVSNSVQPGGIHPIPNQTTGGNGPATGMEVALTVTFTTPINLPAGHYFFVPQVQVSNGDFLWLSSVRPIVAPGTPFAPDLQSWTRDAALDPDWLRVGTDIVGSGTFNQAFTLTGQAVPEPGSIFLVTLGVAAIAVRQRLRKS